MTCFHLYIVSGKTRRLQTGFGIRKFQDSVSRAGRFPKDAAVESGYWTTEDMVYEYVWR